MPVGTITTCSGRCTRAVTVTNNLPAQDGVNGATAVTAPSGPYGLLVVPALAAEAAGRLNYNDLLPSPTLRDSVERVVRPLMPPGTTVGVHAPGYQGIGVAATVIPAQALLPSERAVLKQAAEEALYAYFNPVSGGPDHTGWPFGRPVHLGDAYSVLDRLPGVGRVRTVLLYPMSVLTGERGEPTERVDVTDLSTVFSVDHQVTVEDIGRQAAVIPEVDKALKDLIEQAVPGTPVMFDAPTREWSDRIGTSPGHQRVPLRPAPGSGLHLGWRDRAAAAARRLGQRGRADAHHRARRRSTSCPT